MASGGGAVEYLSDTEAAVRAWLRDTFGPIVFFGIPDAPPGTYVTLSRVGGGWSAGADAPIDEARLTLSVRAPTKREASTLARQIIGEVEALGGRHLDEHTVGYGGTTDLFLWQPDADSGAPRYIVDVTILAGPIVPTAP